MRMPVITVMLNEKSCAICKPYDSARLELFEVLAVELQQNPLQVLPADTKADPHLG